MDRRIRALNKDGAETHIHVKTTKGNAFPCPVCGRGCKVYDTYDRKWRGLDMGETPTYIRAKVPRTDCPEHGIRQVDIPWAREYSRHMLNFERKYLEMMRKMPVNAVARVMKVSDDVLWNILRNFVLIEMDKVDMSRVRRIVIDWTSCRKGRDYITLFVDMDSRRILFAAERKDSGTVDEFTVWFKEHKGRPDLITDVSCDMSKAFNLGVVRCLPNTKMTLDRFHVMKMATETVDKVRKDVQVYKGLELKNRFWLLKRNSGLREHEKEQLDIVLKENVELGRAHILKEMLGDMYLLDSREDGGIYLNRRISFSSAGAHDHFKHLSNTISRHKGGIGLDPSVILDICG